MPWTTPGTATAGDVLTAAFWNTQVRDQFRMGQPVFTNEAARDAAITSPEEGMVAYLTAPTVPAATSTTVIPTGILTVYNGTVWVCTTEVGSLNTNTATTTSTTYVDLSFSGSLVSVTLVTGTTALVSLTTDVTPWGGSVNYVSVKTGTVAATDNFFRVTNTGQNVGRFTTVGVMTGLTAGTNTFTVQGRITGSGTISVANPFLAVRGIA